MLAWRALVRNLRVMSIVAFIGLGANLGDPARAIREALARLDRLEETRVTRTAPSYGSSPVGPAGQADYVNTVAELSTKLEPHALLAALKRIERDLGRVETVRWGPRIIDLDILLYGNDRYESPDLTIPHPELSRRRFVLQPLCMLVPDLVVPGIGASIRELFARLEDDPQSVWPA